jgi:Family of unknown function (DUF6515)
MKKTIKRTARICFGLLLGAFISFAPQMTMAQGNKKGKAAASKPAANNNRTAPSKSAANNTRTAPSKPANKNVSSGTQQKPDVNRNTDVKKTDISNKSGNKTNVNNSGNKNINSGNKNVNVDNSKKNVNINVDNSKNVHVNNSRHTTVRHNSRPYGRPPYVYGGRRYRCYHPYVFHPFRPFVWGPRWHPWGFFVATLATTAIILSIVDNYEPGDLDMASNTGLNNGFYPFGLQPALSGPSFAYHADNRLYNYAPSANNVLNVEDEYWYDEGTYYIKSDGGYTVVAAPLGAKIKTLPSGYETITLEDNTKNYYYGGTFYEKSSTGYTVVAPIAGSVVEHVSEGAEEVKMGDITYLKMGETYYQPIQENGKDMYEVADVEDDK